MNTFTTLERIADSLETIVALMLRNKEKSKVTEQKTFGEFAQYYFETFRKRKVKETTYKNDYKRLRKNILPYLGDILINDISPSMCQELIDRFDKEGKGKTAEEVFSLLNQTFKFALKNNLIQHNPLDVVIHCKHEREHGVPLTQDEEQKLLSSAAEPFRTLFAIGLYTGIRPNEYRTVRIEGNIVISKNSKRHSDKEAEKRIPITPMLRPYISEDTVIYKASEQQLRKRFNKIFGATHKLYDLRTTFYTHCKMCGVAKPARDEFMGHSSGEIEDAYTQLPDEYLIAEGQKLNY